MKIVFWSPTPYSGRKTSNLLLMAYAAAEEGGEQLLLHADAIGSGPEHFLLSGRNRSRMLLKREFGVELLDKLLRCNRFGKELVVNAAYSFAEERLHILPAGTEYFYRDTLAEESIVGMIRQADKVFQNVWVEAPAGESFLKSALFAEADLVVVNFSQSPGEIEKAVLPPVENKMFFLMGAYEKRCAYNKHNIRQLYSVLQGRFEVIPYQNRYLSSCCQGEAEAFLNRGSILGEEDALYPFFREVKKAYAAMKRYKAV